jgi:ElaB/YqjD/DUF883 family membrane-anchored ribosome-binding protein
MSQIPNTTDFSGSTTDRLASMAHETIDRVTPKVNRAEHDVRSAAVRTVDGAKHLQEQAVEATEENLRKVRSYIERNPLTTAGIAFAVGALLSALVRR